ncbi:hypothetical protein ACIRSS_34130 [Amycolatopsis sp. NPDC101161]|uniref:hypothetical protein n=1 Tax=Amycolatopsis sp. NPDC101161 TaxID=3363940 RepID=UPI00381A677C
MRRFTLAGVLAAAVLAGGCTAAPTAQTPPPVPTTVTAEPVTTTVTETTTVTNVVTTTTTAARKAATTRPKAEDCRTGGCLNAARGLSQEDVERERNAWLATHPGWCAVGTTGAVAPC